MEKATIKSIAGFLNSAELEKREVFKITKEHPRLDVETAYEIQEQLVLMKLEAGYEIVGPKMGLTSQAKMKQMGVEEPIFGYVFDYMVVSGDQLSMSELIHPKVEAEVAFIMGKDVLGPDVTAEDILAATEYIIPALEIIDSRYENFNFTLPDVIADNASSARVFLGTTLRQPQELELDLLGVTLSINGEIRELGAGAAILGHPANAIAMLANMLARKGLKIKAGQTILAGAITGAVMLQVGDTVSARFDGLGTIDFKVRE